MTCNDLERCEKEIAEVEAQLRAGHPDLDGLTRALADWSEEKRTILRESQ